MNDLLSGWYLIYTKPRFERKVHHRFLEMDITSFLPTKKTLKNWHDRRKYLDEVLFPNYIFVYLDNMQKYFEALDAEGALYYVRSGKKAAKVNDSVIDGIKLLTSRSQELEVSDSRFEPGRKMVIAEGALTGLSCEIIEVNGKQKILVRVALLQRSLLLTLPSGYLIAL